MQQQSCFAPPFLPLSARHQHLWFYGALSPCRNATVTLVVNGTDAATASSDERTVEDNVADLLLSSLSPADKLRLGVYSQDPMFVEGIYYDEGAYVEGGTESNQIRHIYAEAVPINEVLIPSNDPIGFLLAGGLWGVEGNSPFMLAPLLQLHSLWTCRTSATTTITTSISAPAGLCCVLICRALICTLQTLLDYCQQLIPVAPTRVSAALVTGKPSWANWPSEDGNACTHTCTSPLAGLLPLM
jgi:hypothetical protein